jgi:hypothetical protein
MVEMKNMGTVNTLAADKDPKDPRRSYNLSLSKYGLGLQLKSRYGDDTDYYWPESVIDMLELLATVKIDGNVANLTVPDCVSIHFDGDSGYFNIPTGPHKRTFHFSVAFLNTLRKELFAL